MTLSTSSNQLMHRAAKYIQDAFPSPLFHSQQDESSGSNSRTPSGIVKNLAHALSLLKQTIFHEPNTQELCFALGPTIFEQRRNNVTSTERPFMHFLPSKSPILIHTSAVTGSMRYPESNLLWRGPCSFGVTVACIVFDMALIFHHQGMQIVNKSAMQKSECLYQRAMETCEDSITRAIDSTERKLVSLLMAFCMINLAELQKQMGNEETALDCVVGALDVLLTEEASYRGPFRVNPPYPALDPIFQQTREYLWQQQNEAGPRHTAPSA